MRSLLLKLQLAARAREVPENCLVSLALSCVDGAASVLDAQATLERYVKYCCEQFKLRTRNDDLPHLELRFQPLDSREALRDLCRGNEGALSALADHAPSLVDIMECYSTSLSLSERVRFRDTMLQLSALPAITCAHCGELCYSGAETCLHAMFRSSDAAGLVEGPPGRRGVKKPWTDIEAKNNFTCIGCRGHYVCPLTKNQSCGGELLLFRFSVTQLNVLLSLLIEAARTMPGFTVPSTLNKQLSKYPKLSDLIDYYRSSAYALWYWDRNFSPEPPEEDINTEPSSRADQSRMSSLAPESKRVLSHISWQYLLAALDRTSPVPEADEEDVLIDYLESHFPSLIN